MRHNHPTAKNLELTTGEEEDEAIQDLFDSLALDVRVRPHPEEETTPE